MERYRLLKGLRAKFQRYVEEVAQADETPDSERSLQLATATLLIEMTRADFAVKPEEREAVHRAIAYAFKINDESAKQLLDDAEREADAAVSLYDYTNVINEHFGPVKKVRLVELLWRVAFADGEVDRYEEHLVRKVADLIYVPHREFIRAKLAAAPPES